MDVNLLKLKYDGDGIQEMGVILSYELHVYHFQRNIFSFFL